jgi:hypothetical protein
MVILSFCITAIVLVKKCSQNAMFMRYYHLLLYQPIDLYKPILCDDFKFQKGFEKIYKPDFKYSEIYDISIYDKGEKIPIEYHFKGKIRIDFYLKDKIIRSEIIIMRCK